MTVINDSLLFNAFQPSVVFHMKTVIWFALQTMPGFYIECYTANHAWFLYRMLHWAEMG